MISQLKDFISDCQEIKGKFSTLQSNLQQLNRTSKNINNFLNDCSISIEKWQFKNEPRLARIHKLLLNLNTKK